MCWHGLPSALLVLLLLGLNVAVSDAQKEFADCGSTALMPVSLELDPDPAEVRTRVRMCARRRPHSLATTGDAVVVAGYYSQARRVEQDRAVEQAAGSTAPCRTTLGAGQQNGAGCFHSERLLGISHPVCG
jgi:hypothetical protein